VTLRVPSLIERRSDIPLLAERFLHAAAENAHRGRLHFSEETTKTLIAYDWSGNVRELESAIEYAALHARGMEVVPADLPPKLQGLETRFYRSHRSRSSLKTLYEDLPLLDEFERRYLVHVLGVVKGNRTHAAEILGIDRRTLYRMAQRYGIKLDGE
ncbi:MAG: helix-turn-helix domain-containing protein, partial [Pyrinomonadaceae bacterium]